jgi:RNA polymerase sigma factor (sigma-70 family)
MDISSEPVTTREELSEDAYVSWHRLVEPRLRAALVAEFGADLGRDATSEALSYVWENRLRVLGLDNSAGYAFRVGQRWARRQRTYSRRAFLVDATAPTTSGFEPELHSALAALSTRQRQVVVLCAGYGLTHAEVAALLGISRSSVQNHVERGLRHLRTEIRP